MTELIISSIAGIVASITAILSILKYFDNKKIEQNQREFKYYHKLIKDLVEPGKSGDTYLDRQTAIIFELRNFKRYYEHSLRMLRGLIETKGWGKGRIGKEIELTISFIEKKWSIKKISQSSNPIE